MPRFACPSCRWITTSGTPSCAISTAWACRSWCLCRRRHNHHYADLRVMPTPVRRPCSLTQTAQVRRHNERHLAWWCWTRTRDPFPLIDGVPRLFGVKSKCDATAKARGIGRVMPTSTRREPGIPARLASNWAQRRRRHNGGARIAVSRLRPRPRDATVCARPTLPNVVRRSVRGSRTARRRWEAHGGYRPRGRANPMPSGPFRPLGACRPFHAGRAPRRGSGPGRFPGERALR